MVNVEVSTVINRPVEEVFAFVTNFENLPKWETDIQEAKQIHTTPNGVGSTYQCVLKMPGQTASSKFVITEYEPNQKIAFAGEPAGPATAKGSFLFERMGDSTKITVRPRPEFRGFFKLLEPMMTGYIRKQNVAHLSNLKQLLER